MTSPWNAARFAHVDWPALNSQAAADDCESLATIVGPWLEAEQDADRKEALKVLRFLLRLSLVPNASDGEVLQPRGALQSVPRDAVIGLVANLDRIEKLELRTRIADAAWLHGRACSYQVVAQCAREYLTLAQQTYDGSEWVQSHTYLQRAVDLAASLGRNQALFTELTHAALEMLRAAVPHESLYFSRALIELLLEHRAADAAELGALANEIAARFEPLDPFRERDYLNTAVECWTRADQPEQRDAVHRRIATSFERQAARVGASPDGAMHAAILLEDAVTTYRMYAGGTAEVQRLKAELTRLRAAAVAALPRSELGEVDLTACVERARNAVAGKNSWEALIGLASLSHPRSLERLRANAKRIADIAPLSSMMDFVQLRPSGQVTDRRPGSTDPSDEPAVLGRMHADAVLYHELLVIGGIVPALEILQLEHGLSTRDFFYIASRSSFVPRGREPAFAIGLAAGARREFFTAAHTLVPQLEHALRFHLNERGIQTLSFPTSGGQDERDLGAVLDMPELLQLYDEATIFDWKALLTEKSGSNLRNEIAHGLIDPGAGDAPCAYLWWSVLRCVVAPILNAFAGQPEPGRGGFADGGGVL